MDYNTPPFPGQNDNNSNEILYSAPATAVNSMATTAMVLGILSLTSVVVLPFYLPVILGSVAVVLSLLSRGGSAMSTRARIGLTVATVSILFNIGMLITGIYYVYTRPELQQQLLDMIDMLQSQYPY